MCVLESKQQSGSLSGKSRVSVEVCEGWHPDENQKHCLLPVCCLPSPGRVGMGAKTQEAVRTRQLHSAYTEPQIPIELKIQLICFTWLLEVVTLVLTISFWFVVILLCAGDRC